jgi:hypothetical protein
MAAGICRINGHAIESVMAVQKSFLLCTQVKDDGYPKVYGE